MNFARLSAAARAPKLTRAVHGVARAVVGLLLVSTLAGARTHDARTHDARTHDAHITQSRVVVDKGVIQWRVRCFADDLEKGIRAFANAPTFVLTTDRRADSLVTAYFNAKVTVDADGRRLRARLVESNREADVVGGAVQVYTLRLDAGAQPKSLTMRNALLFEQFNTEQNLVLVLAMPGERRRSLYFTTSDDSPQTVTF